ncbi:MAG: 50S ribosomal protein L9 [Oscillospiraceae bacterium]|jgi:large subunit ribosomal protein L9|nr:50S ribosomal protein L9 [Oscillospiraceae bacterium]
MKIILQQDVKALGKKGELVSVSDGYARNFLFPRKLAAEASAQALNELKNRENAKQHKMETELAAAKEAAAQLEGKTVRIHARAGSQGRLFGSVTAKEVAEEIARELGVETDRRKITMEDIKTFGTFPAEIRFHAGVAANFYVLVGE